MKILLRLFSSMLSFEIPKKLKEIDKKEKIVSVYGHDPEKVAFEKLIKWFLKHNFNFITTDDLFQFVHKQKEVKRPVWLSFDDGWQTNFTNILPILEKYTIPAIFFISTTPIESGTFWWTKAQRNIDKLRVSSIKSLFELPNKERKDRLDQINEDIKVREALTVEELQLLSNSKYVTIGNHTDDHVNCSKCSNRELIEEIEIANKKIKSWTGISVRDFAYPGGYRNKNAIGVLKQLGFRLAASTEPRLAASEDDKYVFPRTGIKSNPVSVTENILMALGIRQTYVSLLGNMYKKH
jgi:peptidoglycan/xylan/chitin deacetylase (PgdA/CDA1 family)